MRLVWIVLILVVLLAAYFVLPDFLIKIKYPLKYESTIIKESKTVGFDPSLVSSLIYHESRFNPKASSVMDAYGLMQVQLPTARDIYFGKVNKEKLREPEFNIAMGTRYLKRMIRRYDDKKLALIAYNIGPTKLDVKIEKKEEDYSKEGEGMDFARNVLKTKKIYQHIYSDRLKLEKEDTFSDYMMWKMIFTN